MHKIRFKLLAFIILSSSIDASAQCTPAVNGTIYQVTTTADGGPGSLRQAILDANAANIGGIIQNWNGLDTFLINSMLPPVTCDSLVILYGASFDYIDGQGNLPEPGYTIISNSSCMFSGVTGINFLPTTLVVSNTNDGGDGSLRYAIEYSNFSVSDDIIAFNIPGPAPHAIQPITELPAVLHSLTINGNSQPPNGFTGSGPTIELDGVNNSFQGLTVDYDDINFHFSVFGMYIHGFNVGIRANNGFQTGPFTIGSNLYRRTILSGNNMGAYVTSNYITVENTWVGTDTSGMLAEGNAYQGLYLLGGPCILQNNLISGNDSIGATIGSWDVIAKGNKIGTDKTGNFAIPNQIGIKIMNPGKIIFGGPNSGDGNLVSGNTFQSGLFQADTIIFCGNKFGTDITGNDTISGGSIMDAAYFVGYNLQIGGPTTSEGNVFAGPGDDGVYIMYFDSLIFMNNVVGTGLNGIGSFPFDRGIFISANWPHYYHLISGNKIANNDYGIHINANPPSSDMLVNNEIYNNTSYGIYNGGDGQVFSDNSIYNNGMGIENTPGSNNSISPPVFTYVDNDTIIGTSEPFATIELFYNLSYNSNPQGHTMIGSTAADASGNWIYQGIITNPTNVTATQTDTSGNTSEFSPLWIQTVSTVWPGDCNYDLVANNLDFLYLGMSYGNTGPVRSNASINWTAQPAADWSTHYPSGLNHKHADTDGNGIVDTLDVIAIQQNFGLNHPLRIGNPSSNSVNYDLTVTAITDSVAPGAIAVLKLEAGSNALPFPDLYGISWSFSFDISLVDTTGILVDYSPNCIGTIPGNAIYFEQRDFPSNLIYSAITRTDQVDTLNTHGMLATIHIPTDPNITSPQLLWVYPTNSMGMNFAGSFYNLQNIGDFVVIDPAFTNVPGIHDFNPLTVFPNPALNYAMINLKIGSLSTVSVYNTTGQLESSEKVQGNLYKLNTENLEKGIYTISVTNQLGGTYYSRLAVIR